MRSIYSIAGEALSLLKLKVFDQCISQKENIEHQILFLGNKLEFQATSSEIGGFTHTPIFMELSSATHASVTAEALQLLEKFFNSHPAKAILLSDDSNASLAAALSAIKTHIPVINLHAGLRSKDRRLSYEINRRLIDSISELFFTQESAATKNLLQEGNESNNIHQVGSLLSEFIDTNSNAGFMQKNGHSPFVYCDFRHPSNDTDPIFFPELITVLQDLSALRTIKASLNEKTKHELMQRALLDKLDKACEIQPTPTLKEQFQLINNAELILTDYGNTQEICTFLNKQCITFGTSTDRPMTVEEGTNHLVGTHLHEMRNLSVAILEGYEKKSSFVHHKASDEMVKIITSLL